MLSEIDAVHECYSEVIVCVSLSKRRHTTPRADICRYNKKETGLVS